MFAKIIYFDLGMLILDSVTISDLRKFLLDFLRVKKSRSNANAVYAMQSLQDKITLSFIKAHLKKYIKEFTIFHRMYMVVMYTLIPQYFILIMSNVLLGMKSMYVLCFFAVVKLIVCFLVRINVDSNRVSIYRRK
jgi:hypothetical protein